MLSSNEPLSVSSHVVSLPFLKSVDLPMADVVVLVRQRLLAHADFAPTLGIILASVKVQRERQSHLDSVMLGQWEEFCVDIEHEESGFVLAVGADSRDSVIFGAVDILDHESILEKKSF